jgi:hypothetical protein
VKKKCFIYNFQGKTNQQHGFQRGTTFQPFEVHTFFFNNINNLYLFIYFIISFCRSECFDCMDRVQLEQKICPELLEITRTFLLLSAKDHFTDEKKSSILERILQSALWLTKFSGARCVRKFGIAILKLCFFPPILTPLTDEEVTTEKSYWEEFFILLSGLEEPQVFLFIVEIWLSLQKNKENWKFSQKLKIRTDEKTRTQFYNFQKCQFLKKCSHLASFDRPTTPESGFSVGCCAKGSKVGVQCLHFSVFMALASAGHGKGLAAQKRMGSPLGHQKGGETAARSARP